MLPDWGDGDWTHMWAWNTANLVRAGSYYHDGEYLDAARRMYDAHIGYYQGIQEDNLYPLGLALRWLDPAVPFKPLVQEHSAEVIDDLVSKKITFRSPAGDYGLLNYRDQGPYARWQREPSPRCSCGRCRRAGRNWAARSSAPRRPRRPRC